MKRLSLVDFAAMPYPSDTYPQLHVIDDLHDAVVSHANAPLVAAAFELFASSWTRLKLKRLQLREYPFDDLAGQSLQFLAGARLQFDGVPSHATCLWQSGRP